MSDTKAVAEKAAPVVERRKGSFAVDVAKLAGGTTFVQALGILIAPVLTRLYPPDAFGTAAVLSSLVSILAVVSCLRYELAIMLPDRDQDASSLLVASLVLVPIVAGLGAVAVLSGRDLIITALRAPELEPYLALVPLFVLANGAFRALSYWNSRAKRFGEISIVKGIQSVVTAGGELGLAVAGIADAGGLIAGRLLGALGGALLLGRHTWRYDRPVLRAGAQWRALVTGVKRYKRFPLYSTWSALLNSISWQLRSLLLSSFFSSSIVGYYALGTRALRLPMSLIGGAIGQVFFQRAAEARAEGTLKDVVEGAYRRLVMLGMFPLLLLSIVGRDLFTVAFGDGWAEAGVYTQILSVWTFFWFISSPLSTLYSVLERQKAGLALNIVNLVTRVGSLVVGGWVRNPRIGLALFGVSGVFVYGYLSMMIMGAAGVKLRSMLCILLHHLLLFLPPGSAILAMKALELDRWVQLSAAGGALILYYAYVLRRDPQLHSLFRRLSTPNLDRIR